MAKTYEFPKDFLWGTATSSYQIEGNNTNTDWWQWENSRPEGSKYPLEKSGIAADSYNRFEEDFDLCVELNNNAVRISIEWARIEPRPGYIDIKEVEHYKKVLQAAKDRGLKTLVTLHHFTLPQWSAQKGGWKNSEILNDFANYTKLCAQQFGHLSDVFITMNEPLVYAAMAYINGIWPPAEQNVFSAIRVQNNLIKGHIKAYKAIKSQGNYTVGLVENVAYYFYQKSIWTPLDFLAAKFSTFINCDLPMWRIRNHNDFIGLNFYFSTRYRGLVTKNIDDVQSDLGWWVFPEGLEKVLLHLKKFNKPIYVTENGAADGMDRIRKDFIKNMLISCHRAIEQGVNLKGYFHWSLIDNFEWHQGFWPHFGLVYIDRNDNLKRKPRPSFYYYAEICRNGRILE